MNSIKKFLANGIYYTKHALEKMKEEKVTEKEILEVLNNSEGKMDYSKTYRINAWNIKPHITFTYNNLTVVACESKEKGILIISVYHGRPKDFFSNPNNRKKW